MDIVDLKREIRNLREQRSELESERNSLLIELESLEQRERHLKQEFNVIGAVNDLNNGEKCSAHGGDGHDQSKDSELELKFRELNKKLEIKVLNHDIKATLPRLEAEVLLWESKINEYQKIAKSIEEDFAQLPSHIMRNSTQLEEELGSLLEKRLSQKAEIASDIEGAKREKKQLSEEVRSQRNRVAHLDAELWVMRAAALKAKAKFAEEEVKIKELADEQTRLKDEIDKHYSDGRGWLTEAFSMNAGSVTGTLPIEDLPSILQQWMPPALDCSEEAVWLAYNSCSKTASPRGVDKSGRVNLNVFCAICDNLLSEFKLTGR